MLLTLSLPFPLPVGYPQKIKNSKAEGISP